MTSYLLKLSKIRYGTVKPLNASTVAYSAAKQQSSLSQRVYQSKRGQKSFPQSKSCICKVIWKLTTFPLSCYLC